MPTITVHRDGYTVEAQVGIEPAGPGFPSGQRAVLGIDAAWITDPDGFREAWGLPPTQASLDLVMSREMADLEADLLDTADIEAHAGRDYDEDDLVERWA